MIFLRRKGFTMIEMLVVISIAAILLAIAVPSLRPQVASANAKAVAADIAEALRYARQYALNTSGLATFTPNGCGYAVTNASGTQLLSGTNTAPTGVSCTALTQTVSFLGDGSAVVCSTSSTGQTCSSTAISPGYVAGGGSTWKITVTSGGVINATIQ